KQDSSLDALLRKNLLEAVFSNVGLAAPIQFFGDDMMLFYKVPADQDSVIAGARRRGSCLTSNLCDDLTINVLTGTDTFERGDLIVLQARSRTQILEIKDRIGPNFEV